MSFKSIQKLNVERTLTTGEMVSVDILAQNRQGVFFQYDENYISRFGNLSLCSKLQSLSIIEAT